MSVLSGHGIRIDRVQCVGVCRTGCRVTDSDFQLGVGPSRGERRRVGARADLRTLGDICCCTCLITRLGVLEWQARRRGVLIRCRFPLTGRLGFVVAAGLNVGCLLWRLRLLRRARLRAGGLFCGLGFARLTRLGGSGCFVATGTIARFRNGIRVGSVIVESKEPR